MHKKKTVAWLAGLALALPLSSGQVAASGAPGAAPATRTGVAVVAGRTTQRPGARPALLLTMNKRSRLYRDGSLKRLHNFGRARLSAVVVRRDGGKAKRVDDKQGGRAARLPTLARAAGSPRAAIRVTNRSRRDKLDPGRRDFVFGADFKLNGRSAGRGEDDGDNLVQRGGFDRGKQYKIQLDGSVPLCRLKGSEGTVLLSTAALPRKRWYRVRCSRIGTEVRLKVWKLTRRGQVLKRSASEEGVTGPISFPRSRPLSVGGRLTNSGKIPGKKNDPFNGVVDHVYFTVQR
jgi:hypothetical protein